MILFKKGRRAGGFHLDPYPSLNESSWPADVVRHGLLTEGLLGTRPLKRKDFQRKRTFEQRIFEHRTSGAGDAEQRAFEKRRLLQKKGFLRKELLKPTLRNS